jgi:small subunit ribosomal protein S6e
LAQFKLVISDSSGKSVSKELRDRAAQPLLGLKIGETLDASAIGLTEGKIKITGGSDKSGTPMRQDVHGGVKKYVLLSPGVGMRSTAEGIRMRKLVRGNTVTEEIYQLNCALSDGDLQEKAPKRTPGEEKPSPTSTSKPSSSASSSTSTSPPASSVKQEKATKKKP